LLASTKHPEEKALENPSEKKRKISTKKIKIIVVIAIAVMLLVFAMVDLVRSRFGEDPIFAVPLLKYDSGSADFYGIGYKVYKDVNFLNGEVKYYYAAWFVPKYTYVE
jgi:hypothetical protein